MGKRRPYKVGICPECGKRVRLYEDDSISYHITPLHELWGCPAVLRLIPVPADRLPVAAADGSGMTSAAAEHYR
mgnify:CR=1 FL=1